MPVNAFSSWRYEQPYGGADPATPQVHYGPEPFFRDGLDARRSAFYQTPEAMYPDGYLGTIRSRRDDRLLNNLKDRQSQRSYQRGVHKGERIDPRDYFWDPNAMTPTMGLERQAQAVYDEENRKYYTPKQAPAGVPSKHLTAEGKMQPRGSGGVISVDRARTSRLNHLRPSWAT